LHSAVGLFSLPSAIPAVLSHMVCFAIIETDFVFYIFDLGLICHLSGSRSINFYSVRVFVFLLFIVFVPAVSTFGIQIVIPFLLKIPNIKTVVDITGHLY